MPRTRVRIRRARDGKEQERHASLYRGRTVHLGWRAWLNNTTITLGMNNVFDQDPPFVKGPPVAGSENGYDPWQANIRGRVWYVALKKRF